MVAITIYSLFIKNIPWIYFTSNSPFLFSTLIWKNVAKQDVLVSLEHPISIPWWNFYVFNLVGQFYSFYFVLIVLIISALFYHNESNTNVSVYFQIKTHTTAFYKSFNVYNKVCLTTYCKSNEMDYSLHW